MSRAKGTFWPCLHCGALLQMGGDSGAVLQSQIAPDAMARVRQLVVEGKAAEAKALAASLGISPEVVDATHLEVMMGVLWAQKMNAFGFLLLFFFTGVALTGAYLVSEGTLWGWGLVVVGVLLFLPLLRPLATALKMAVSPRGVAEVRRVTHIGTRAQGKKVGIFAFDVLVTPEGGAAPFGGSLLVPVREESLNKAVPGARIVVRYKRSEPAWLRFDRMA